MQLTFISIEQFLDKLPPTVRFVVQTSFLTSWVEKVDQIKKQTKILRVYFNNHYGGKAVVNALEFKEMIGMPSSEKERKVLEEAKHYLSNSLS